MRFLQLVEATTDVWYHGTPEMQNLERFEGRTLQVSYLTDPALWLSLQAKMQEVERGGPEYFDLIDASGKLVQYKKVRSPTFFTNNHQVAKSYALDARAFDYQRSVPGVVRARIGNGKRLVINARGQNFRGIEIESVKAGLAQAGIDPATIDQALAHFVHQIRGDGKKITTDSLAAIVDELGFDIIDVMGIQDNYMGGGPPATVRMVMDPSLIHIIRNEMVESTGGYLYHGTGAQLLPSIQKKGVIPQKPVDIWPEYDDDYTYDAENDEEIYPDEAYEPRTFWTDSQSRAMQYAENSPNPVVMRTRADTAGVVWNEGETDHPYFYATETIPPNVIEYLLNGQWTPLVSNMVESGDMGWGGCWIKPNGEVLHLIPNENEPIHHAEHVFDDPDLDALVDQRLEQDDDADSRETAVDVALEAGWIRVRTHTRGPGEIVVQYEVPPSRQARRELYDYVMVHRNTGRFYMNSRKFNSADELLQAVG